MDASVVFWLACRPSQTPHLICVYGGITDEISSDHAQVRAFDTVNTFCEPERQTKCHLFPAKRRRLMSPFHHISKGTMQVVVFHF